MTTSMPDGQRPGVKSRDDRNVVLEVDGLRVEFRTPLGTIYAVNGVDLLVHHGETLGVLGESGSGKSVTAQAIMGLIESPPGHVVGGRILFEGRDISAMSRSEHRRLRGRRIGMVFQDAVTSLDPGMTVGRQIGEVFRAHEDLRWREARRRSIELMERVGIPSPASRVDDYPHQFSGGMSQRIMVATAIALSPDVLIADEPTTALDVTVQAQIMDLLVDLQQEYGMALMLITHDLGVVAERAENVAVMYAGRVVESGPVRDVFDRPAHPYTVGLMGATPQATHKGDRLLAIPGTPPMQNVIVPGCAFAPRCPLVEERCRTEWPAPRSVGDSRMSACHRLEEVLDDGE